MVQVGESLREFWLQQGVRLTPGASEEDFAAFEAKYSVRLPSDLREYYAAVNGFDGSEYWMTDDEVITFLGLDEVKPLSEYWTSDAADGDSHFVFADYSISAHVYAVRLASDCEHGNSVVVVYDSQPIQVANSFSEFVAAYLENDHAVLYPDPQPQLLTTGDNCLLTTDH